MTASYAELVVDFWFKTVYRLTPSVGEFAQESWNFLVHYCLQIIIVQERYQKKLSNFGKIVTEFFTPKCLEKSTELHYTRKSPKSPLHRRHKFALEEGK